MSQFMLKDFLGGLGWGQALNKQRFYLHLKITGVFKVKKKKKSEYLSVILKTNLENFFMMYM
jgi:hypothetical protein